MYNTRSDGAQPLFPSKAQSTVPARIKAHEETQNAYANLKQPRALLQNRRDAPAPVAARAYHHRNCPPCVPANSPALLASGGVRSRRPGSLLPPVHTLHLDKSVPTDHGMEGQFDVGGKTEEVGEVHWLARMHNAAGPQDSR
ncbi:hypothetical protein V492_05947 [Pseudogymnoascus sp. VKM F-4246]|nr:hypothetical protein V492_05947 [Pseudogymnoascus sp. VKM F-4246]